MPATQTLSEKQRERGQKNRDPHMIKDDRVTVIIVNFWDINTKK